MFQVGDRVVYGIHGVCRIDGVEERTVDRKKVRYFVLVPVDQSGTSFYVPSENPVALSKLRHILTREELDALLKSPIIRQGEWIQDENKRKLHYRELIATGDRVQLLQTVHALHQHKRSQQQAGRKFHLCDEYFLRDVQKLLDSEFSLVLGIPAPEVERYILESMGI